MRGHPVVAAKVVHFRVASEPAAQVVLAQGQQTFAVRYVAVEGRNLNTNTNAHPLADHPMRNQTR